MTSPLSPEPITAKDVPALVGLFTGVARVMRADGMTDGPAMLDRLAAQVEGLIQSREQRDAGQLRFERATQGGWWIEVEEGAACIAYYKGRTVTNGQDTAEACFDTAYAMVWGPSGVMRREWQEAWHEPALFDAPLRKIVHTFGTATLSDQLECGHFAMIRTPACDPVATVRRCYDCASSVPSQP